MSFQFIKHQCGTNTDFLSTIAYLEGYCHSIIFYQIKKKTTGKSCINCVFTVPLIFPYFCACSSQEMENIFSKDEKKWK